MVMGLKQALNKMEDTEAFKAPRVVLSKIIDHLEHPKPAPVNLTPQELAKVRKEDPDAFDANGALSPIRTLYNRMERAAETLNSLKIYVNGFRVPHIGKTGSMETSPEAAFMENTALLREASKPAAAPERTKSGLETMAEEEKDKLIDNATQYLSLKYIYEDVCHLKPDNDQFYLELLKNSKTREPILQRGSQRMKLKRNSKRAFLKSFQKKR